MSNLFRTVATSLAMTATLLLCACGGETPAAAPPAAETDAEARSETAQITASVTEPTASHTLKTGQPVVSLAAIPATAHLGKSHIIAAHGPGGVSMRDTSGTVLWTLDTPARLVAQYQGLLVIYAQNADGETTLERYRLNGSAAPTLVDTASPSPIAATTLQRTAIASLGPLQISGSDLIIADTVITAPGPITAVASAGYFPPLVSGQTLLIATDSGDIIIQANTTAGK